MKNTLKAKIKNIKIETVDTDPVLENSEKTLQDNSQDVCLGLSTLDKIKIVTKDINDDDAIFTANQEEISYLLNKRDFSKNYSSSVKKQKIIVTKNGIYDINHKIKGRVFADKTTTNAHDKITTIIDELDELPTPYKFDVTDFKTLTHDGMINSIKNEGVLFFERKN